MRVLYFRHPNTRSPAPFKKQKLATDVDLSCHEHFSLHREWTCSDPDFVRVLQEREGPRTDGKQALERHPELSVAVRAVLVDWMTSVAKEFSMRRETLYASVHLMDKYLHLCNDQLPKREFQLVGLAALFISSKFEEASAPSPEDMASTTGFAFSPSGLLRMEKNMLKACGWRVPAGTEQNWAKWTLREWKTFVRDRGGGDRSNCRVLYQTLTQLLDSLLLCPPNPLISPRLVVAASFFHALRITTASFSETDYWQFAKSVFDISDPTSATAAITLVAKFAALPIDSEASEDCLQWHNACSLPLFKQLSDN